MNTKPRKRGPLRFTPNKGREGHLTHNTYSVGDGGESAAGVRHPSGSSWNFGDLT